MRLPSARALGVIAIAMGVAAGVYRYNALAGKVSGDFAVICSAGSVLEGGGNPYHLPSLSAVSGSPAIPFGYPPLTASLLRPLCGRVAPVATVVAGTVALVAMTARVGGTGVMPAAWAVFSGFAVFPWLLITGNVMALVEGFCGLAVVWGLARGRPAVFGAAVGVAAAAKLMPAAFLVAAFVRWPMRVAMAGVLTAVAVFAGVQIATFATDGAALARYWTAVGSGWDGFVQAELQFGSENNPSMFSFLPIAAKFFGAGAMAGYAVACAIALMFAAAWYRVWRSHGATETSRLWLAILALGVIVIAYPRFKPYTVCFLLPATALVFARLRGVELSLALIVVSILPNAALVAVTSLGSLPAMPAPVVFALQYAQWLLAAAAVALALSARGSRALVEGRAAGMAAGG